MSDRAGATQIDTAVDAVLRELEEKRAAADLLTTGVGRMRAAVQLAAILAWQREIAKASEQLGALALNGAPAETLVPALQAADAEGRRLLAAMGVDLPALAVDGVF